jgi:enoyl-CoA hydratase
MSELLDVDERDRVLVMRMQREEKRNAVDRQLADALEAALNRLEDDDGLWAGVLTGTSQTFSAGSDLTADGDYDTPRGGEYGIIRRQRTKPLVAAVEGPALGGGMEIVLACDLVSASTTASFGLPEPRVGLVATCAALFRAPRALPLNLARQLLLTGEPIDATRAHTAGFVNVLTAPGGALDAAVALAEQICASAPGAVRATLAAIDEVVTADEERGWEATRRAIDAVEGTADQREGVAAFLERRAPVWREE